MIVDEPVEEEKVDRQANATDPVTATNPFSDIITELGDVSALFVFNLYTQLVSLFICSQYFPLLMKLRRLWCLVIR